LTHRTRNDDAAPVYPRIYRVDGNTKLAFNGLGITMSLFAVASLFRLFGAGHVMAAGTLLVASCAGFAFWVFYLLNQQIILYADAIEKVTWFSRRTLKREDILGWYGESYRGYTYILVPRESRAARMRDSLFRWDKVFFEWKKSIPHISE
jgi:hypothetical protein